jgi:hypothetical protein
MWRRVSCEQPLNTSQSILSPTRSRYHCKAVMNNMDAYSDKAKGNLVSIPEPGDGTALIVILLVGIMSR